MSLTLWRQHEKDRASANRVNPGMLRSEQDWQQIFREQTDGSPQEAAARIFGDLHCYTATRKVQGWSIPRDPFFTDVEQVARALEAYVAWRSRKSEAA